MPTPASSPAKGENNENTNRPNKRKELSPEAVQDKEKLLKQYESLTPHPSVLRAEDLNTSPVCTKSLNIAKKCEMAGISEAGGKKMDIDTVYSLVVNLSARVSTLENQLIEKDEEIFNLRKDQANLEKQLNEVRSKDPAKTSEEDSEFLDVVKRELPLLSDQVSKNESEIQKLQTSVTNLGTNIEGLEENANAVMSQTQNEDVQKLLATQKEDQLKFVQESRKNHLKGEGRDQYTMRDTIRVTGVPYKQGENTNDIIRRIAYSIGVIIGKDDISVSHRTGRRRQGVPRAIICKFTRRDVKYAVLQNKRLAKSITHDDEGNPVKIYIDEKLTPMRANVCKFLRAESIQHHTKDGKIFIPKPNSTEFTVLDTMEDWINWERSDKTKIDLGVYPQI